MATAWTDAPRARVRDRAAERDSFLEARSELVTRCGAGEESAMLELLGVQAWNLTVNARNCALMAAAGCPPITARYAASWRKEGYRIIKGTHGYPIMLQRGRTGWRHAGSDVERSKGQGPEFSVRYPVASQEVANGAEQLARGLEAIIRGEAVALPTCLTLELLEEARRIALEAQNTMTRCPVCDWDGEGEGGCDVCR